MVAISEFVRHDIGWPTATVIVNGADHVPDLGTKSRVPPPTPGGRLRVGCPGAAGRRRGVLQRPRTTCPCSNTSFNWVGVPADLEVMGSAPHAERLEADGFVVHLNATDDERTAFLRGLDVFASQQVEGGTPAGRGRACAGHRQSGAGHRGASGVHPAGVREPDRCRQRKCRPMPSGRNCCRRTATSATDALAPGCDGN